MVITVKMMDTLLRSILAEILSSHTVIKIKIKAKGLGQI